MAAWHWAKSCHEFRYYDTIVEPPPADEAKPVEINDEPQQQQPRPAGA